MSLMRLSSVQLGDWLERRNSIFGLAFSGFKYASLARLGAWGSFWGLAGLGTPALLDAA